MRPRYIRSSRRCSLDISDPSGDGAHNRDQPSHPPRPAQHCRTDPGRHPAEPTRQTSPSPIHPHQSSYFVQEIPFPLYTPFRHARRYSCIVCVLPACSQRRYAVWRHGAQSPRTVCIDNHVCTNVYLTAANTLNKLCQPTACQQTYIKPQPKLYHTTLGPSGHG